MHLGIGPGILGSCASDPLPWTKWQAAEVTLIVRLSEHSSLVAILLVGSTCVLNLLDYVSGIMMQEFWEAKSSPVGAREYKSCSPGPAGHLPITSSMLKRQLCGMRL